MVFRIKRKKEKEIPFKLQMDFSKTPKGFLIDLFAVNKKEIKKSSGEEKIALIKQNKKIEIAFGRILEKEERAKIRKRKKKK